MRKLMFVISALVLIVLLLAYWLFRIQPAIKGRRNALSDWNQRIAVKFVETKDARYDFPKGFIVRHYDSDTGLKVHVTRGMKLPYVRAYNEEIAGLVRTEGTSAFVMDYRLTDSEVVQIFDDEQFSSCQELPISLGKHLTVESANKCVEVKNELEEVIVFIEVPEFTGKIKVVEVPDRPFLGFEVCNSCFIFSENGDLVIEYFPSLQ